MVMISKILNGSFNISNVCAVDASCVLAAAII